MVLVVAFAGIVAVVRFFDFCFYLLVCYLCNICLFAHTITSFLCFVMPGSIPQPAQEPFPAMLAFEVLSFPSLICAGWFAARA
ncbi:membrane protein [Candidatus Magnetobacterium bavaricum]|uniref:Membrane protein n=1 Tax=Candidatus Magnetobacterium bavaricum TaxID=29290 RepID=A0A0F3GXQ6_9BACT|nr:membrane protein [Candidatus Magnetobacterium bavaricum]